MSKLSERDDTGKLPLTGADRTYLNLPDNSAPRKPNAYIRSVASHTHPPAGGRGFPVADVGHFTGGGKYPAGRKKSASLESIEAAAHQMVERLLGGEWGAFPHYEVSAGGTRGMVYSGRDENVARKYFDGYVELSKSNYEGIAGQPVTLFRDNVPIETYEGTIVANGAN